MTFHCSKNATIGQGPGARPSGQSSQLLRDLIKQNSNNYFKKIFDQKLLIFQPIILFWSDNIMNLDFLSVLFFFFGETDY